MVSVAIFFCFNVSNVIFLVTGSIYIFIVNASPNRASLGATNGLSQVNISLVHSLMACIQPAL